MSDYQIGKKLVFDYASSSDTSNLQRFDSGSDFAPQALNFGDQEDFDESGLVPECSLSQLFNQTKIDENSMTDSDTRITPLKPRKAQTSKNVTDDVEMLWSKENMSPQQ